MRCGFNLERIGIAINNSLIVISIIPCPLNLFHEIHQYYDTEFKNLFMKYIIIPEKHFKSIFTYYFAEKYHTKPYCYLDTTNYSDGYPLKSAKALSYISNKIYHAKKDNNSNAIKHHYYAHNDVPIWVIVNDITFRDISNIYQLIDNRTRNDMAKEVCKI